MKDIIEENDEQYNYIVLVLSHDEKFLAILRPNTYAIQRWVGNLSYATNLRLYFISTEQLRNVDKVSGYEIKNSEYIQMDYSRSMSSFVDEIELKLAGLSYGGVRAL